MTYYEMALEFAQRLPKAIEKHERRALEYYDKYNKVKDLEDERSKELKRHYVYEIKSEWREKEECEERLKIVKENIKIMQKQMQNEYCENNKSNRDDDYSNNPNRFLSDRIWNDRENRRWDRENG